MEKRVILLSKKHAYWLLLGAAGFIAVGILFTIHPDWFTIRKMRALQAVRRVGIFFIVFFSLLIIYGISKKLGERVGLIIDESGIIDNTAASGVNFIHWGDIVNIKRERLATTDILLIYVLNPEDYMEQGKWLKRSVMSWNYDIYGTPLCVSDYLLRCSLDKLEGLLAEKLKDNEEYMQLQSICLRMLKLPYNQMTMSASG